MRRPDRGREERNANGRGRDRQRSERRHRPLAARRGAPDGEPVVAGPVNQVDPLTRISHHPASARPPDLS
jgi:hypothetical protein